MSRDILYKRPKSAKSAQNMPKKELTPEVVVDWIVAHPMFTWSTMCREVGLNPATFYNQALKAKNPRIKDDLLPKMAEIMANYGFNY